MRTKPDTETAELQMELTELFGYSCTGLNVGFRLEDRAGGYRRKDSSPQRSWRSRASSLRSIVLCRSARLPASRST
jgi:hypothetical protein